jgi:NADPH-dependent 2,4-dienoyl-CoA reductase/sulfur reductase-like enzyme
MAADAAVRGIREIDAEGTIAMIGTEADPPYARPPLSKGLWQGKAVDGIWRETAALGVDLQLGRSIRWIDAREKEVVDDRGTAWRYDKLLLATGSAPRRLPVGDHQVIYFRSLRDYWRLRDLSGRGRRFAVIGGGFIGSEIAAALASIGKEVVLIFPGTAIGDRLFPLDLARSLNDAYRARGVQVLDGHNVVDVQPHGERSVVRLRQVDGDIDRELLVDGVVAGIGTQPNIHLARFAGLTVDDGIVVDPFLRTSHPDIYAAGDVATVMVPALGGRRRFEHEDSAKAMGRHVGRVMAGVSVPYDHLPFFYSDLFDQGYEAVGDLDPTLQTVADWADPQREGVVYYLRGDRVRGVLLWNVWGQIEAARALIRQGTPVHVGDLRWSLMLPQTEPVA